jgi:hypothetical protein
MKSFAYVPKDTSSWPTNEQLLALKGLGDWLTRNVPGRWSIRGNVINFEHDEDVTLFLLIYAGNAHIRVVQV